MEYNKKIFISHASADKLLVDEITNFLSIIGINYGEIFNSSADDPIQGIPNGKNFMLAIKEAIKESNIVICILTENYLKSKFCMMELGSFWMLDKKLFPLIVPPLEIDDLNTVIPSTELQNIIHSSSFNNLLDELKTLSIHSDLSSNRLDQIKISTNNRIVDIIKKSSSFSPNAKNELLANRLIELILTKKYDVVKMIFKDSIIHDLAEYFKESIKKLSHKQKADIRKFLEEMYSSVSSNENSLEYDGMDIDIICEQCCYYISYVNDKDSYLFLENVLKEQKSLFIKRGVFLGTILSDCSEEKKINYLQQYINQIENNPLAASINAGYHQFYYGDKFIKEGYIFNIKSGCSCLVSRIIRHLGNEKYKYIWPIDIFTIYYVVYHNSTSILNSTNEETVRQFIRDYENNNSNALFILLNEELKKLKSILDNKIIIQDIEYFSPNGNYIKQLPTVDSTRKIDSEYKSMVYIDDDFYDYDTPSLYYNKIKKDEFKMQGIIQDIKNLKEINCIGDIAILDVGCSYGAFDYLWFKSNLGVAQGIEISQIALNVSINTYGDSLNIFEIDAIEIDKVLKNNIPNMICFLDSFEHIFDVDLLLYKISILTPVNTLLLIYLPIIDYIGPDALEQSLYLKNDHIYYFTLGGINDLLNNYGFCLVDSKKFEKSKIVNGKNTVGMKYLLLFKKQQDIHNPNI